MGPIPIGGSSFLKTKIMDEKQTGFVRFINELGQVIVKEMLDKMIEEEQDLSFSRLEVD